MNVLSRMNLTVAPDRMLTEHLRRWAREAIGRMAARRQTVRTPDEARAYVAAVRQAVRAGLGPMPFGSDGGAPASRVVARHEREHYVIENVLFESFPGWEVNANVYVPKGPGPFRAVICPCGHSGKEGPHYQRPPQIFARNGYIAVVFDAPGRGEKNDGNDHFLNGVQCYPTGAGSSRYFLMDALRTIDYLATRADVDLSGGVAMTGVSGGGITTLLCAVLDERIACLAPVCCIAPFLAHPIGDLYTSCPEDMAPGKLAAGVDVDDLLSACWPRPVLMVAGANDEVFLEPWFHESYETVSKFYAVTSDAERVERFVEPGGHDYSVATALRVVQFLDRHFTGRGDRSVAPLTAEQLRLEEPAVLHCHPSAEENMFTINRRLSRDLTRRSRETPLTGEALRQAMRECLGLDLPATPGPAHYLGCEPVWSAKVERWGLEMDRDVVTPMLVLRRLAGADAKRPALLWIDERGKFGVLKAGGLLTQLVDIFDESQRVGCLAASVDAIGWGETTPENSVYDLAGWCDIGRLQSYLANSLSCPILGLRVRDALAALAHLRGRKDVDGDRIVVGGYGLGAAVALHTAVLDERVAGLLADAMPACFAILVENPYGAWGPDAFPANVLKHYDLPELLAQLARPAAIVAPHDRNRQPLSADAIRETFAPAMQTNPRLTIRDAADAGLGWQLNWLRSIMG